MSTPADIEIQLRRLDGALRSQDQATLTQLVAQGLDDGLLSAATLAHARALRLVPTVLFLATLGQENLDDAAERDDRARWLAAYQSVQAGGINDALARISSRLPLKWTVRALLRKAPAPLDRLALHRCQGDTEQWLAACELALDFLAFDVLDAMVRHRLQQSRDVAFWLGLARSMLLRMRQLRHESCAQSAAALLAEVYQQLPHRPELAAIRDDLPTRIAELYCQGGRFDAAIAFAQRVGGASQRIQRLGILATAHCHRGDLETAIARLDELLETLADAVEHQRFVAAGNSGSHARAPVPEFDVAGASRALVDLQQVLSQIGQVPFLVSGTLLGYAREGQLLAHDKDVDVGVVGWKNQYDIIVALLESGRFQLSMRTVQGQDTYHVPVLHLETGVSLDIFIYHEQGGKLVTGVQSRFGYLQTFAFTPFKLKAVRFLGVDFHVPEDVDLNLRENFGNWRISDPNYISHLESPSTLDVGGPVYQLVARLTLLRAIQKNNRDKHARALALLQAHRHRPCGMDARRLRIAEQLLDGQVQTLGVAA